LGQFHEPFVRHVDAASPHHQSDAGYPEVDLRPALGDDRLDVQIELVIRPGIQKGRQLHGITRGVGRGEEFLG
jgi:hypothetical protein